MTNILIVRQRYNMLGDTLCSLPMYKALKKKFPDSNIDLIFGETSYPIPYNEIVPLLNNAIKFRKNGLIGFRNFIRQIRKVKYDYVIEPSTQKISRTSQLIAGLSKSRVKVGVKSIDNEHNKFHFLLNIKNNFKWNSQRVHQIYRLLDVVKQIDCNLNDEEIKEIKLAPPPEYFEIVKAKLANFKNPGKKIFTIHPGGGKLTNIWDKANFVKVIEMVLKEHELNIVLTSGPIDKEIINYISSELTKRNIEYFIYENDTYSELSALFDLSTVFLTNDTGVMHLAAFTKTNVVSLFGPTQSYEWGPIGEKHINIQSPTKDINQIEPQDVFEKLVKLL